MFMVVVLPLALAFLPSLASAGVARIVVDTSRSTHRIGWTHGCHTDLGYSHQERGIFSQLLHGESFENMSLPDIGPDRHSDGALPVAAAAEQCGATGSTSPTCFGAGDELATLANITSAAACCAACASWQQQGEGAAHRCNVWTVRAPDAADTPRLHGNVPRSGCHLRSSWQRSSPRTSSSCETGVLSGPLPPNSPDPESMAATTTMWTTKAVGAASVGLTSSPPILNGVQAAVLRVDADGVR